jgi:hypothetical protein
MIKAHERFSPDFKLTDKIEIEYVKSVQAYVKRSEPALKKDLAVLQKRIV